MPRSPCWLILSLLLLPEAGNPGACWQADWWDKLGCGDTRASGCFLTTYTGMHRAHLGVTSFRNQSIGLGHSGWMWEAPQPFAVSSLKAFLPPLKQPRSQLRARNVDSQEGTEKRSEVEAAVTWLKESWEGFNATYSHLSQPGDAWRKRFTLWVLMRNAMAIYGPVAWSRVMFWNSQIVIRRVSVLMRILAFCGNASCKVGGELRQATTMASLQNQHGQHPIIIRDWEPRS